ncbi:exocyst complex subunit Sec15-like protein [Piedraia hortae CBS 480.64]|uniref:Exocyst complex component SEC15 n=1 Tax=Piedraia hortae CBS 480.64 TaxID=1314780 RepID=A0A6A7BTB8_9PEZI|nr:exocyst complex subunit Sec15-like protein [Piedraia hortae CBS 480.64]
MSVIVRGCMIHNFELILAQNEMSPSIGNGCVCDQDMVGKRANPKLVWRPLLCATVNALRTSGETRRKSPFTTTINSMPGLLGHDTHDDLTGVVQQIILSSSEADYLDQLIPLLKSDQAPTHLTPLIHALNNVSADREAEIEKTCNNNHQDFISSVQQLQSVRQGTVDLASQIIELSNSIEASTERLAAQKKALVDSRSIRQNINEATRALKDCLEVLRLANQVHDLLGKKSHYAALRALDELQTVHLRQVTRYNIASIIERSVPATQKLISEAVMTDLNTWLYRIRETSQFLGEIAFYHTEMRRARQKQRAEKDPLLGSFKLNSAVELVADESEEFDVLNNDEVQVDFTPLFEALHIHEALGQTETFRTDYAATRRRQRDLLLPTKLDLLDEDSNELSSLLEGIAGFAIVERATMQKTSHFRAQSDVDELWDSMVQSAISLITAALPSVESDEKLLKIKGVLALFIQTMDSWSYPVHSLDGLLLTLFDKYNSLLKKRFSDDFTEIVNTDDYMPMPVETPSDYERVLSLSFYTPPEEQRDPSQMEYPCILPFSQMYPLVCMDIRNLLTQTYLFADDHFRHAATVDQKLQENLDDLLVERICQGLVSRLASQYPGQIVQILTNLDHFEGACAHVERLLVQARPSSSSAAGPITLKATQAFRDGKVKAEQRIFELVESKVNDLIETAEYHWTSTQTAEDISEYMQELTRYLSNIMSSVLLGLPEKIKDTLYQSALSFIQETLLALPLDPAVESISAEAASAYAMDVGHLIEFVQALPEEHHPAQLISSLEELRQTAHLMSLTTQGQGEQFFDTSVSAQKFGKVDKLRGAELLTKIRPKGSEPANVSVTEEPKKKTLGDLRDRFGIRNRS